jgi:hypothetical protein
MVFVYVIWNGGRGRRRRQLLDDLKEKKRYWKLKEEALDRTLWRTRSGRGYGPVVRQTTEWMTNLKWCWSQWPRGLGRGSAAVRLLGLWVRIPPGAWMSSWVLCCQVEVCAVGWSLFQRSPIECGVSECDREASTMRRPWPTRGCSAIGKKWKLCDRKWSWPNFRFRIGIHLRDEENDDKIKSWYSA